MVGYTEGEIERKCFGRRAALNLIDDVRRWTGDDMNVARTNAKESIAFEWKEDTTAGITGCPRVVRPTKNKQQHPTGLS